MVENGIERNIQPVVTIMVTLFVLFGNLIFTKQQIANLELFFQMVN